MPVGAAEHDTVATCMDQVFSQASSKSQAHRIATVIRGNTTHSLIGTPKWAVGGLPLISWRIPRFFVAMRPREK